MDFTWLTDALTTIVKALGAAVTFVGDLFKAVFVAAVDMFKDLACWALDQILGLVISALGALDVDTFRNLADAAKAAGSIPASVLQVLAVLGVGQALALIAAALTIRFALQLIPFVRLGS